MNNYSIQTLTVIRDALTDYYVNLRTIHCPGKDDKLVSHKEFLAMDISPKRRENYLTAYGLRNDVDEIIADRRD